MRNKIIGLLGLALAGLFLAGCASTTQIVPTVADEKPTAGQALIVVEGSASWDGMFKLYAVEVFDNKTLVGKVAPHGKLAWLREPGPLLLEMNRGAGKYLTVAAGEKYQFKVECSNLAYALAGPSGIVNELSKENAENAAKFIEGWSKLQKGMTFDQVHELLGNWGGLGLLGPATQTERPAIPPYRDASPSRAPNTIIIDGYTLEFSGEILESWSFQAGRNAGKSQFWRSGTMLMDGWGLTK